jgi:hypothetical protein
MRILDAKIRAKIEQADDQWVTVAKKLAETMPKNHQGKYIEKKSQLHNLQALAERGDSWLAFELFLKYQAARGELDSQWVQSTAADLANLRSEANRLVGASGKLPEKEQAVHMELVSRVLGFTVRWHIANVA